MINSFSQSTSHPYFFHFQNILTTPMVLFSFIVLYFNYLHIDLIFHTRLCTLRGKHPDLVYLYANCMCLVTIELNGFGNTQCDAIQRKKSFFVSCFPFWPFKKIWMSWIWSIKWDYQRKTNIIFLIRSMIWGLNTLLSNIWGHSNQFIWNFLFSTYK